MLDYSAIMVFYAFKGRIILQKKQTVFRKYTVENRF